MDANQFLDARVRKIVVMIVANKDGVEGGQVPRLTGGSCESLRAHVAKTLLENRVEQSAEPRREFDEAARMA